MVQDWFTRSKLGIFLHWGIYGVRGISESWSLFNHEVSYDEYMSQLSGFTAKNYHPEEWADLFVKAGAKYSVLTTKHHDGVALWDTKYSDLNVVNKTLAGRDLIGPYCEAVRKAGLKVGLYFSHLDWSHPDYPTVFKGNNSDWSKPFNEYDSPIDGVEYPDRWEKFLIFHRGQLKELMENYNPDLLWFDGDWTRTSEQWRMKELREYLHSFKEDVIFNSRMCECGDYETPEQAPPITAPEGPWEFCMTMNDSWGYRPDDMNYKSIRKIIRTFCECISLGGNLLLDIGPKPDGTIDKKQEQILLQLGEWIRPCEEAIYDTKMGIGYEHFLGGSTLSEDDKTLFIFVYERPWDGIVIKGIYNAVKNVTLLNKNKPLHYVKDSSWAWAGVPNYIEIDLKEEDLDENVTVIKVELEDKIKLYKGKGKSIEMN